MKQPEFHRRYRDYPDDTKFELIGGIVYRSLKSGVLQGDFHGELVCVLKVYAGQTPGVKVLDNATTILTEESEPQPDISMFILPDYGGQPKINEDDYLESPPELLVEVSHSTRSIDMHQKKEDYRKAGVLEYLVICLEEKEIYWFQFSPNRLLKEKKGVYKSKIFSGLWIDVEGLWKLDNLKLLETLQKESAAMTTRYL